jgi:hypothetical protein
MGELGDDLDLSREAVGANSRSDLAAQELDRHLAVMHEVLGEMDLPHPADAQRGENPVRSEGAACGWHWLPPGSPG